MDNSDKIKLLQYLCNLELEAPPEYIDIEAVNEDVNEILTLRGETTEFTAEEISEKVAQIPFV